VVWRETPLREKAQIILAALVLLVSGYAAWQAHQANRIAAQANSTAEQAIEYAREANLIAMGAMREYPQLEVL
jgi:hypothetical protein